MRLRDRMVGFVLLVVLLPWIRNVAVASDAKVDLAALEALTGRWIALRSELAGEQQAWQRQEGQWQREIGLLRREVAERRAALEADTAFLSGVEEAQSDLQVEKEKIEASLQLLDAVIGRHEALLRGWQMRVPPSLQPEGGVGFRALPANDAIAMQTGVLRRLQTVLVLYTQIETLQNNIHLVRELIDLAGVQREAAVLYIGLARGFAVSASGDWAAIGVPGDHGWVWQDMHAEAPRIRLAIRTLEREAEAQLVPLLWALAGEGQ
ncbi:MAG: DUF3450 family protein [Kiritimatiellia bacterium]